MSATVLVDTGPLVALLVRSETHHDWASSEARQLGAPLHTCEPVLTEAAHLLRRAGVDEAVLLEMLEAGLLRVSFDLEVEASEVRRLLQFYRNVPMSLADACLVRMSELLPASYLDAGSQLSDLPPQPHSTAGPSHPEPKLTDTSHDNPRVRP